LLFVSKLVICVVLLLNVMFCVLFVCKCVLPPGVNRIAVDKYIDININININTGTVGARFSGLIQTRAEAKPATCKIGNGSFSESKAARP
jgi:hypothetical protein